MSVARFIADQRARYRVPHAVCCALVGVSQAWFYKWIARAAGGGPHHTDTDRRRAELDAAVRAAFIAARRLHGSPRLVDDLRDQGWTVSEKTVADSMRRQGLVARKIRHRQGLTRQGRTAPKFPDLLKRGFSAAAPNCKWVGDMTEIPTATGKLYLATVIDLYSRRLLGAATSQHPDAELACSAIEMAAAARGGADNICGVVFHTDNLLALLMAAEDPETGYRYSDLEIRDELMTFLGAGFETTAAALAWTWCLLSENLAVRSRLGYELDEALAGRDPGADDVEHLPWTRAVLDEAMRRYPPIMVLGRVDDSLTSRSWWGQRLAGAGAAFTDRVSATAA